MLTSRHFTYLVEGDAQPRERLTDWELASRLSYFLWSSMPDQALFDAARDGKLTGDGDGLAAQVDRMLADPKIDRFIDDFPRQWLQLHRLGMFPPDGKLYPDYDVWLEASMREEVVHYFREVFANNLPIDCVHHFRLDDGQSAALRFLRPARTEDVRLSARVAAARASPRRSADHGGDPRAHLRRHAASSGASRRLGQRSDLRQDAAATAGERRSDRAESAGQPQGDDSAED